ncbi:MAG: cell division protein FtsB [Xanthomonadales bacterium]|nr:cell division protein FtsB [Xanthomonadales bacterium]
MLRWVMLVLLLLLVALQFRLWFGDGGMRQVWQLERDLQAQRAENDRLSARNAALAAEVEDLRSGREAVEERAREELGMVAPGEGYFQVVEPGQPGDLPAPAQPAPEQDSPQP